MREDFLVDFWKSGCPQLPGEFSVLSRSSSLAANSTLQVADWILRKFFPSLATEGPALPYKLRKTFISVGTQQQLNKLWVVSSGPICTTASLGQL